MFNIGNNSWNAVCKDEVINEWRLNEIKDNVSGLIEMVEVRDTRKSIILVEKKFHISSNLYVLINY